MTKINRPLGWTTLEESKQLVEMGLPVETADMSYTWDFDDSRYVITTIPAKDWIVPKYAESTKIKQVLPCWSLGALLELIPDKITYSDFKIKDNDKDEYHYFIQYYHSEVGVPCETHGYTPVEAFVNMILLLNNGLL